MAIPGVNAATVTTLTGTAAQPTAYASSESSD